MMIKRLLAVLGLSLLFVGCATITNLTATSQPRNAKNLYLVEYQWDSNHQKVVPDSIKPHVVIGFDSFEMQLTPKMTNRWEAYIPVAPDKDSVIYHFKVDYEYPAFGKPGHESKSSPEYKLYIR
jgi:hypothetical protein